MLSKISVSGIIKNSPEKRFNTNNVAITSFILEHKENTCFKVVCFGKLAETTSELQKNSLVFVNGNLEITKVKTDSGAEKTSFLINAKNIDRGVLINNDTINEDYHGDDLIGEDEIPF